MKLTNPYESCTGEWLKGQLHLHTTHSDGADAPATVVEHYEALGFDFIAFTDHDTVPDAEDLAISTSMILVPGLEYRCGRQSGSQEVGVIGAERALPPGLAHRDYLDAARASGGFVIYNHPTWHVHHWPIFKMLKLHGAHGLEIYNAHCDYLPGASECGPEWDRLLTSGYRIWGVATDDSHRPEHRGRGWIVLNAERSRDGIVDALKAGRFYASSGVSIESIRVEGGVMTVESSDAEEIRFFSDRGSMRLREEGSRARYTIRDEDIYVRAELFGRGAGKAWTQPVFVESDRSRTLSDEFLNWYLAQQAAIARW